MMPQGHHESLILASMTSYLHSHHIIIDSTSPMMSLWHHSVESIAYIPLRREHFRVWALHWSRPPTAEFRVGDTNMLVSKNAKICVTPNAKTQCQSVEYRWRWVCVVHVDFMLFVSISFALASQSEPSIQWNMGLWRDPCRMS